MILVLLTLLSVPIFLASEIDIKTTSNFSVEVTVEGDSISFSFALYSATRPFTDNVEFEVNDEAIDFIRIYKNKCHTKKGECAEIECMCLYKDNIFIGIYKHRTIISDTISIFGFSFIDEHNRHTITLSRTYNGTEFGSLQSQKVHHNTRYSGLTSKGQKTNLTITLNSLLLIVYCCCR